MFKTETYTIGDIKDKKGDIQLPLAIFSEILKDGGSDLAYVHGNERHNGCIDSWLKAQGLSALREK